MPDPKHTYVPCRYCELWSDEFRHSTVCVQCNNTKTVIDPKEILCNMCGECMCPLGTDNEQYPNGLHNAKVEGGYDSDHLLDMSTYTFNLCEKCLRQMFVQCKIPPHIGSCWGDLGDDTDNFAEDQTRYEYKVWQKAGGHHQAYLNKKCNVVTACPNKAIYTLLNYGDFTEDCCCEEHKEAQYCDPDDLVPFIPDTLKAFI